MPRNGREYCLIADTVVASTPMYSREEVKAITDKVLSMASKATGAEVDFSGGERSATRFANSTITANMVQFDRQVSVTVRQGSKTGSASTRPTSTMRRCRSGEQRDEGGGSRAREPQHGATARAQTYLPVNAALTAWRQLRPGGAREAGQNQHRRIGHR